MNTCKVCGSSENPSFFVGGECQNCYKLYRKARQGSADAATKYVALGGSLPDFIVDAGTDHTDHKDSAKTIYRSSKEIWITSETKVDGVEARLGFVTGQCVLGMNIFRDLTAEIRDIVGGRSGAYQKSIKEAKDTCISEMKDEAARLGADAIVAVDMDFNEISGGGGLFGGKGMIMVIATGTAVKFDSQTDKVNFD